MNTPDSCTNPVELRRFRYWRFVHHPHPLPGTALHLLLVPLDPVPDVPGLPPNILHLPAEALAEFWTALTWARDTHGLSFYGLAMGAMEPTAAQLVVGDATTSKVEIKIYGRPGCSTCGFGC